MGDIMDKYRFNSKNRKITEVLLLIIFCVLLIGRTIDDGMKIGENNNEKNGISFYQCKDRLPYGIEDAVWELNALEFEEYTGWDLGETYYRSEGMEGYLPDCFYVGDAWVEHGEIDFKTNDHLVFLGYEAVAENRETDILGPMRECLDTNSRYIGDIIRADEDGELNHFALWETDKSYSLMLFYEGIKYGLDMMYIEKEWLFEYQGGDDEIWQLRELVNEISNSGMVNNEKGFG